MMDFGENERRNCHLDKKEYPDPSLKHIMIMKELLNSLWPSLIHSRPLAT
jgi:hypothetical protein